MLAIASLTAVCNTDTVCTSAVTFTSYQVQLSLYSRTKLDLTAICSTDTVCTKLIVSKLVVLSANSSTLSYKLHVI